MQIIIIFKLVITIQEDLEGKIMSQNPINLVSDKLK